MARDQKWKAQQGKQLTVQLLKYCFDSKISLQPSPILLFGFSGRLGYKPQWKGSPFCQHGEEGSGGCLVGMAEDSRYQGKSAGGRGATTQKFCGLSLIWGAVELHEGRWEL